MSTRKKNNIKKFILKLLVATICSLPTGGGIVFSAAEANAQQSGPIKIGAAVDITGAYTLWGAQVKRSLEFIRKEVNDKGGLLGRKVEFIFEDAGSDPATCLRKMRKLVESDGVKILTGAAGSDESRAFIGQLAQWNAIFVANIVGSGIFTGSLFSPYYFRPGHSIPMASRTLRLYMRDAPLNTFMTLILDTAYGRSVADSFEKEIKEIGRTFIGHTFFPKGTKDFSSWISRIQNEKPDALLYSAGDPAFLAQAKGYGLLEKVQILLEQVNLYDLVAAGDAIVGAIGSSRYSFTLDNPENRAFVKKFYSTFKEYPDMADGETYHTLSMLFKAIGKAGTADDVQAIIKAFEGLEYTGIKGKCLMRGCDHQAINSGIVVKAVKSPEYPFPKPEIVKIYPGEQITPPCRKDLFD